MYELIFMEDIPAGIIAAPPSFENSVAVTGFKPLDKTELIFNSCVLSSLFIRGTSSSFALPRLLVLELINVAEAAAKSCGLESKKFIPFDAFVGTMLNSSPSRAVPKNDSLNPSVSIACVPVTGVFRESAVRVHMSFF